MPPIPQGFITMFNEKIFITPLFKLWVIVCIMLIAHNPKIIVKFFPFPHQTLNKELSMPPPNHVLVVDRYRVLKCIDGMLGFLGCKTTLIPVAQYDGSLSAPGIRCCIF